MTKLHDIYRSLEYGPSIENHQAALDWLDRHDGSFGHFINGQFTDCHDEVIEVLNPASHEILATTSCGQRGDVNEAVEAAQMAFDSWSSKAPSIRARYLYALTRNLQKHSRLFAVLETLNSGKPLRESRDIDIPLAIRHFYFHAGASQIANEIIGNRIAIGVCGQIIPWNFPLLMLAWKIAPAIAMGNTVVLKPAEYTPLTALLFADLCRDVCLPPGVVNIVTGRGETGAFLVEHPAVNKIAFTGSTEVGRDIRRKTAGTGKFLTLELGGKSPYIVFDDADLDSAIEGLCDGIWLNQGQVCCAGSRLLVQESVAETFHRKLRTRMNKLRVGNPLDKCVDVGAIIHPVQLQRMTDMVNSHLGEGQNIYRVEANLPKKGCYYPPTLVTGLSPSSTLMQEEIFGPILVSTTFRTLREAVELANNTRYGLAASVWSENINLALDIAPKLECGVVWINGTNMFDAAAEFGGKRESGFGREGGWGGLAEYTQPMPKSQSKGKLSKDMTFQSPKTTAQAKLAQLPIDRTFKHYINGKQVRPDSGLSIEIRNSQGQLMGHVGKGNRKDIRNAVEAARHAYPNWRAQSGHSRAQILYFIAENLSAQSANFVSLAGDTRPSQRQKEDIDAEIQSSCDTLFTYAAWADKFDGRIHAVPFRGLAMAINEPMGVAGAVVSSNSGLGEFIAVFAPLIAMGNTCVLSVSGQHSLSVLELCKILATSDVPDGVINVVSGLEDELALELASHNDVDSIWHFGDPNLTEKIETLSAGNLKRTWILSDSHSMDSDRRRHLSCHDYLSHACEIKNIWVPYGD